MTNNLNKLLQWSRWSFSTWYGYGNRVSVLLLSLLENLIFVGKIQLCCLRKKKFASNFFIKRNPFSSTNGATRCVADVLFIDNNQNYGAPYPRNSRSQHCDAAGDLRLPFWGLKRSFASDQNFSTVFDVPSRPCSPDVQHHPGHRTHSDHLDSFLDIAGRDWWAIAGCRCVPAPQNVAQCQYHPHHTTHPKVDSDTFSWSMRHFHRTDLPLLRPCMYNKRIWGGGRRHLFAIHRLSVSKVPCLMSAPHCTFIASAAREERNRIKRPNQHVLSTDVI